MQPDLGTVHRSAALSAISIGYKNQMFIGDRVFQNVPVLKQEDYFYLFRKGALYRNDAGVRGPGGEARRGGYVVADTTYNCKERAFAHPIPIEVVNNADDALAPWETGVNFATLKVMLAKEVLVSALCCTASNWTTSHDAAASWAAGAGNTFIEDMLTAKKTIRQLIGLNPNVLVMDAKTLDALKQESSLLDRIKYTGTQGAPADVTTRTLAQLFELDEVLVGGAIYSSAEETLAGTDFTAVDLWETNATKGAAFLFYRPPAPGREMPAAGYVFQWKGGAGHPNIVLPGDSYRDVRYWWEDSPKQYVIEASETIDAKVTCADAGYLFYDTIVT
jgi:hypothetical protein